LLLFRSRSSARTERWSVSVPLDEIHIDGGPASALALEEAFAALEPYERAAIIPSAQVINPLLDVWSVAQSIHSSVALPVEDLLTTLVSRSATTRQELLATFDEVRMAAVEANVLANALM
jgi:hypothetical protein